MREYRRMEHPLTARAVKTFQRRLLDWFGTQRRDLPWRASRDPYRVWVAEIMLQQTRIAAVMPYYERFLAQFPTVEALAGAAQDDVLKCGPGSATTAGAKPASRGPRDCCAARRQISARARRGAGAARHRRIHGGGGAEHRVRRAARGARRQRGAGPRAAGRDARRPARAAPLARLAAAAQEQLAPRSPAHAAPGDWNQALMELGETICAPQIPRCPQCPVARWCLARARGLTREIPAPRKKRAVVRVRIAAMILRDPRGRTLLVQDPGAHDGVLFSRMWQFPAVEVTRHAQEELAAHVEKILDLDAASLELEALPAARHGVTFRNVTLLPFLARVARLPSGRARASWRWTAWSSCRCRARRIRLRRRWGGPPGRFDRRAKTLRRPPKSRAAATKATRLGRGPQTVAQAAALAIRGLVCTRAKLAAGAMLASSCRLWLPPRHPLLRLRCPGAFRLRKGCLRSTGILKFRCFCWYRRACWRWFRPASSIRSGRSPR